MLMEITASITEPDVDEAVKFTSDELKIFVQEIADMVIAGEEVDIGRAVRNAKYLAGENLVTNTRRK